MAGVVPAFRASLLLSLIVAAAAAAAAPARAAPNSQSTKPAAEAQPSQLATSAALSVAAATAAAAAHASPPLPPQAALSWLNGVVSPSNSTSPYAGAQYMYQRTDLGSPGAVGQARASPFDLLVEVWDGANRTIQRRSDVEARVQEAVSDIYFWRPDDWRAQLAGWPAPLAAAVLTNKSNFFWEQLAQTLAGPSILRLSPDYFQCLSTLS